jgi:hypothetical protein
VGTRELDHQVIKEFWDRFVVGEMGYLEVTKLVGHIFVGPKAQAFVGVARRILFDAVDPKPVRLGDVVVWGTLSRLFYQYDPALMGRYTSADGIRYRLCMQDNLQCQVFNLFTLLLAQLAVATGPVAIERSNLVSRLISDNGLCIERYIEHFQSVCLFYMEVLCG